MNYKRDFGDHHVSALAMYNQTMKYYPDSNPDEFKSIPRSYIGLVGRATYDWKTRYMVEMNVGYNVLRILRQVSGLVFFPQYQQVGF